eukprot:SAG31_NODE_532_length_14374_cov_30.565254_4_plen_233_part_00
MVALSSRIDRTAAVATPCRPVATVPRGGSSCVAIGLVAGCKGQAQFFGRRWSCDASNTQTRTAWCTAEAAVAELLPLWRSRGSNRASNRASTSRAVGGPTRARQRRPTTNAATLMSNMPHGIGDPDSQSDCSSDEDDIFAQEDEGTDTSDSFEVLTRTGWRAHSVDSPHICFSVLTLASFLLGLRAARLPCIVPRSRASADGDTPVCAIDDANMSATDQKTHTHTHVHTHTD